MTSRHASLLAAASTTAIAGGALAVWAPTWAWYTAGCVLILTGAVGVFHQIGRLP